MQNFKTLILHKFEYIIHYLLFTVKGVTLITLLLLGLNIIHRRGGS